MPVFRLIETIPYGEGRISEPIPRPPTNCRLPYSCSCSWNGSLNCPYCNYRTFLGNSNNVSTPVEFLWWRGRRWDLHIFSSSTIQPPTLWSSIFTALINFIFPSIAVHIQAGQFIFAFILSVVTSDGRQCCAMALIESKLHGEVRKFA